MQDERVTEERNVWLLIKAPKKAPPEVRYSRIIAVYTSELRAKRARAALPLLERVKTHIDEQRVEITGPRAMKLNDEYSVERSSVQRIETHLTKKDAN